MVRGLHPTTLKKLGSLAAIALGDGWPERVFLRYQNQQRQRHGEVED